MEKRIRDVNLTLALDAPLFKAQRLVLIRLLEDTRLTDKQKYHLSGILNMTDDIYDALYPIEDDER